MSPYAQIGTHDDPDRLLTRPPIPNGITVRYTVRLLRVIVLLRGCSSVIISGDLVVLRGGFRGDSPFSSYLGELCLLSRPG